MSLVHGNHTGIECDSDVDQIYDALHHMGIECESEADQMNDALQRDMGMDEVHAMLRTSDSSTC